MQRQAGVGQPFAELGDGVRVVIVEVGTGGEHLDGVEIVRGDMDEVVAREPRFVEEVRRDAEGARQKTDLNRAGLKTGPYTCRGRPSGRPYRSSSRCSASSLRSGSNRSYLARLART